MINPALFAALLQSSQHTLIVAPTGYGKTLNLQPLARKFGWTYLNAASHDFTLPRQAGECYVIDHAHLLGSNTISSLLNQTHSTYVLSLYHSFYPGIPRLLQEKKISIIDHDLLSLGEEQGKKLGLSAAQMTQSQGWPFLCLLMSESLLSVEDYLLSLIHQLSDAELNLLSKIGNQPINHMSEAIDQPLLIDILNKGIPLVPTKSGLQLIPAFYSALRRYLSKQGYTLRLSTLGELQIYLNNQELHPSRMGKNPLLLLTYLILQGSGKRQEIEENLFNNKINYAANAMSLLRAMLKPYFDEEALHAILSTKNQTFSLHLPADTHVTSDITHFFTTFTPSAPLETLEKLLRTLQPFLIEHDCRFSQAINLQLQDRLLEMSPLLIQKAPSLLKARELLLLCLRFTGYDPELCTQYSVINQQLPEHLQLPLPTEYREEYPKNIDELLELNNRFFPITSENASHTNQLLSE